MKKLLMFLMAASLLTACNNDKKSSRDRDDRSSTRDKDDYRSGDDRTDRDDRDKEDTRTEDRDNDGQGWSRSDENRFMDDCEGTAKENVGAARANEYCDCMLQRMKKMYSSYKEADNDLKNATQEDINKLAAPCNGQ